MKQSQVASVSLGASGFLAGALALVGAGEHPKSPATDPLRCVDVPVNVYTYNAQEAPTVAIDGSGRSLVAWGSRRQEAGTFGIYGRLIDAEGRAIEGELHLNQFAPNNQEVPAAAFDSRGVAWVAWQSFEQDGDGAGIVLRRFAVKEGVFSPLGNEMLVNQRTAGDQLRPAVATSGDRAIVCWTGVCDDRQIASARLFDADGRPVSDEITIGSGEGHHWLPAPAVLPDGGFVVAWAQRDAQGRPAGIMARRLDRTGAPLGEPLVVASPGESFDVEPSIDADASGRFVIAWMSRADRAAYEVRLRRFAADGEPIGSTTTVDFAHDGWLSGVAVACAADGRFAVLANREGEPDPQALVRSPATPSDVAAVVFEADGRVAAGPVVVHARTEGRQTLTIASPARRALWSADGALVVAWQGDTGADSTGVALSTLRPLAVARLNDADRPEASSLTGEPTIDPALLASAASRDAATAGAVPPEFDPFFIPDPPDVNPLNPGPDFGFIGFQATGWTPPDPDIAVGPNHIVVVVNGGIRFFTKDGTLLFDQPIAGSNGFWGEVGATSFVFDPVALYDVFSGRYIVAATEHSDDQKDLILLAVSDDSDPNGTWHKYRFDMTSVGDFIDFPNLGVGTNAVYVTCDYFNTPRGNHIHIFRKSELLDGLPTTPNVVRTSNNVRSLGTVKAYDAGPRPQYFATAFSGSSTTIQIDSIRTPLTNPVRDTFNLTVPAFAQPPDADQLGTTNRADTIDVRIKNGVYRNGMLYLAHTIGEDATARVRWYRVQMNGWPSSGQNPVLAEWGTQNLGPGVHNWFADIHVDAQGRMAIAFNRSSSQEYISVQRTFRIPTDTPGTLREPVMQQVSTSPETGSRWGDYSGIEEDPADPSAFWNHHEYRTTSWRTWVGRFSILESLPALSFTYPDGRPGIIDTAGGTTFRVQVSGESETPRADSAVLHVDRGGGSFEPFPMTHLGDHLYEATFPSAPCGSTVKYYVSAESTQNTVVRDPLNAPGSFFSADAWAVVG
ncbi:MAG: hypothetical protein KJZ68_13595, partial [Phycisphaerales bacterium]|nr:hypothetical protein [Phycisphaerales bacterium]